MEYRYLGATGTKVSMLCMGAMTFGREADEAESHRMLDRFVDAGGNFIDTANVYSRGASEEVVGRWLAGRERDDYVIATKVRFPMGDGPNDEGLSRTHILRQVDASLRRLRTGYIDLYQIHCWDAGTPLEETLSALDSIVRAGKVRYIGASNLAGWQLQKSLDLSRQMGLASFVSLQPQYNLLTRSTEWELIPVCRAEGLAVIPWSPLRGGWLSGRYRRGMTEPPANSRVRQAEIEGWSENWTRYNTERTWAIIDALLEVSDEVGRTPAQVAINWLAGRPGVTAPIIGARSVDQLGDTLGAVGWTLPDEAGRRLSEASEPEAPYPYDFIADKQGTRAR